jgi:hypothetical protein
MREVQKEMLTNDYFKIQLQIIITTALSSLLLEYCSHKSVLPELKFVCFYVNVSDKFDTRDPSALRDS